MPLTWRTSTLLFLLATACATQGMVLPPRYVESIQALRAERDAQFRNPEQTELAVKDLGRFRGLAYYEVQPAWRVPVRFRRVRDGAPLEVPGRKLHGFNKVGVVEFQLKGRELSLGVYQSEVLARNEAYRHHMLIPFRDPTNGGETYGGGRYLDFDASAEPAVLDFNLAYNPTCAYDPAVVCPLAPRENRLPLRVDAGERAFAL